MGKTLDTVLLLALPASGKSEVRKYMASLTPQQCVEDMHMGPTLQLDDYPYVHFMHRIDDELYKRGFEYVFYKGATRPFNDNFEWGTLVHLLNEDYEDLLINNVIKTDSAANYLFDRLDRAREKVGLERALAEIPYGVRMEIAKVMEEETREHLNEKNEVSAQNKEGKTVVIEMARGGANGSAFPLTPPQGYQYTLSELSSEILANASILYVWVTPEESRKKNYERAKPDGQSSILHHGVPLEVMLGEYGCDDMNYLIDLSKKPDTVSVERYVEVDDGNGKMVYDTKIWNIPIAKFDNRNDLTTFVREDSSSWKEEDVDKIHDGLSDALKTLSELSKN